MDQEGYPVPKELWFLCDLMNSLGLDKEQMFSRHGLEHEILMIRDWLDTGLTCHISVPAEMRNSQRNNSWRPDNLLRLRLFATEGGQRGQRGQ